jgi:A/G-specific adenine glycosylase
MSAASAISSMSKFTAPPIALASRKRISFRRALLNWYHLHQRDLPWRRTRDPYRIWLSEIMLQQTRVAAVVEYYRTFLDRFPTIEALAAATEDDVLSAWSGLGYYRRARMLHRCAIEVVQNHGGRLPKDPAALLALPGIGRYTAAAIASIAFSEPVAVVDGNVERVLRRVLGGSLDSSQAWQHAQEFLEKSRPGDFNQAMMELGATVCVPRAPQCQACPVKKWCATRGVVPNNNPRLRQHKKQVWCSLEERRRKANGVNTIIGSDDREIRLVQRSKKAALMAGMWELPQSSEPPDADNSAAWRTFRHSVTITDYTVHVLRTACSRRKSHSQPKSVFGEKRKNGKWIAARNIAQVPITGLTRKILRAGGII